jgi:hypothetical protein
MRWGADRPLGIAAMLAVHALFGYYSVWVLATPFIDPGHPLLCLFPDTQLALMIPAALGVTATTLVLLFLASVLLYSQQVH